MKEELFCFQESVEIIWNSQLQLEFQTPVKTDVEENLGNHNALCIKQEARNSEYI